MIVRLDEQIDCNTVCKRIAKMVESYKRGNPLDNRILSIRIVEVTDSVDRTLNIEDKNAHRV